MILYREEPRMNIELSGKNKTVADGITVAELIAQEQLETPEHVKVAVNDDFVERADSQQFYIRYKQHDCLRSCSECFR